MRFDVYGRFQVELRREGARWTAYRPGPGTLAPMPQLVVPPELRADELARFLDDHFHELGEPGRSVRSVG